MLRLEVGGFGHLQHMPGGREGFGTVSFVFEMECEGDCLLKFKEVIFCVCLFTVIHFV